MLLRQESVPPKGHLNTGQPKTLGKEDPTLPLNVQPRLISEFTIQIIFSRGHVFMCIFSPSLMFFKIRKDAEMHNLAKAYLAELIKEECWNAMAVKGRALKVTDRTPGTIP